MVLRFGSSVNVWFQKKIHIHPIEGRSLEIPRGRGVLKAKFSEEMFENKLEIPGGGGVQNKKTFHGGSVDIFWNCTINFLWDTGF